MLHSLELDVGYVATGDARLPFSFSLSLSGMAERKGCDSGGGVALDLPPPALITQPDGTFEVNHAILVLHTKITYHTE